MWEVGFYRCAQWAWCYVVAQLMKHSLVYLHCTIQDLCHTDETDVSLLESLANGSLIITQALSRRSFPLACPSPDILTTQVDWDCKLSRRPKVRLLAGRMADHCKRSEPEKRGKMSAGGRTCPSNLKSMNIFSEKEPQPALRWHPCVPTDLGPEATCCGL